MIRHFFSLIALALPLTGPALAQDTTFTPEDAKALSACTEQAEDQSACIGTASDTCMENDQGSTTIGISACLARETDWWDTRLNNAYSGLADTLDDESFAALKKAQHAWIAWRDSACEFEYTYWREGTIRSSFYGSCMLDLTARRAIDLQGYIDWAGL